MVRDIEAGPHGGPYIEGEKHGEQRERRTVGLDLKADLFRLESSCPA